MANFCLPKNYIFDNSNLTGAHIAQLVEHFHGKEEVAGSILAMGTIKFKPTSHLTKNFFFKSSLIISNELSQLFIFLDLYNFTFLYHFDFF